MTLFDSPAFTSSPAISAPVANPTEKRAPGQSPATATSAVAPVSLDQPAGSSQGDSGLADSGQGDNGLGDGVHHMGDLARLVLLRYQLVAKRRAEMSARRPR